MTGIRRTLLPVSLVALAAALLLGISAGANPSRGGQTAAECAGEDASPVNTKPRRLRKAIRCLVNNERTRSGKQPVEPVRELNQVARKHTKVMRREDCLGHKCPGEPRLEKRIIRSGYLDAGGSYGFGENIGCAVSPRKMVEIWMAKNKTRRIVLRNRFRDFGVGAVGGAPKVRRCAAGRPFGTFTLLMAWRTIEP